MPLVADAPPSTARLDLLDTARSVADRIADGAAEDDRPGAFPTAAFEALREAGLLTAPLARDLGGLGLGLEPGTHHALYAVLSEIGRGSLPVGRVYEGHVNALALVAEHGTLEQQERAAFDARRGHLFGVWNTEAPGDGVHLYPLPGGGVRMEGAKVFCSGLGHVSRAFANGALPDGGWQMALVPLDTARPDADAGWWRAEGMRASASGRADFSGLRLAPGALIGHPGDYVREPSFTGGSVRFAAVQLGGARALADAAVAWLRQLGRTDDVAQRMRIGEVEIAVESGALWLLGAARLADRPDADAEAVVAYAQMARTAIERVCLDVLERVDRAVGARGLLPPSPVERIGRDLRLYLRQPAPDASLAAAGAFALAHDRPPRGADVTP